MLRAASFIAGVIPPITPDPSGLPGGNQLHAILGGVMFYGVMAGVLGFLIGSSTWWIGNQAQNANTVQLGRRAVTGSVLGVILIAAVVTVLNWAFSFGASIT